MHLKFCINALKIAILKIQEIIVLLIRKIPYFKITTDKTQIVDGKYPNRLHLSYRIVTNQTLYLLT